MSEQHDERLAQIRARLAAATPGPWFVVSDLPMYAIVATPGHYRVVATPNQNGHRYARPGETIDTGICYEPDARFIADAPEDIAWLIGEVERLRAEVERLSENSQYLFKSEREQLEKRLRAEAEATAAEADRDAARAELAAANATIEAIKDKPLLRIRAHEPWAAWAEGYNDALDAIRELIAKSE